MIPKVFHRVWLGGKEMPSYFKEWGESWLRHHPGWEMRTWTEKDLDGLRNITDLFCRCSCLAQQSDIVRYEVLLKEGGVYLDTDFECLRNIESLISGTDFFACYQTDKALSNAIFGGIRGHKIFADLVSETKPSFKQSPWNSMGPNFFTPIVRRYPESHVFERKTFIPYTWREYFDKFYPNLPARNIPHPPESYAVNHRSSMWYTDSTAVLRANE